MYVWSRKIPEAQGGWFLEFAKKLLLEAKVCVCRRV
jgi:hypothetical protein